MFANGKITKKLKKLGLKICGIEPQGETISDVIDDMSNIYDEFTGTQVVANPTLGETEPYLRGLQIGDIKYADDDIKCSMSFFFTSAGKIGLVITAKDFTNKFNGEENNINIVDANIFIKDETTGTIRKQFISTASKSLRSGGIYFYKERGDNVRYFAYTFGDFINNPEYSEHIISAWGTVEYKVIADGVEVRKWYGTNVCTYQLPVIEAPETTE